MERVGFHVRVAAFLVDLFLLALFVHCAVAAELYLNENASWGEFGGLPAAALWLVPAVYAVLEILLAATPGKKILRLTIAGDDGRPAPRRALLARAGLKYSPLPFA